MNIRYIFGVTGLALAGFVLLFVMSARLLGAEPPGPGCGDLDSSGFVNFTDLWLFKSQFGKDAWDIPACRQVRAYTFTWSPTPAFARSVIFCDDGNAIGTVAGTDALPEPLVTTALMFRSAEACPSQCFYLLSFDDGGNLIGQSTTECAAQ